MKTSALYVSTRTPRTRRYIPRHTHTRYPVGRVPREWTMPMSDPWA